MAKFGLPTYPINSGMILGHREDDEITWLIEHGCIQSDLYQYDKIVKDGDTYNLIRNTDSRYSEPDAVVDSAESWQKLVQMHEMKIAYWYWYEQF